MTKALAKRRAFTLGTELEQPETPKYTTILHDVRAILNVSITEYVLLDTIYKLSARTGYCFKSPRLMAEQFGISKQGCNKMILRLIARGLLERLTDETLRVTDAYIDQLTTGNKVATRKQSSRKAGNKVAAVETEFPKVETQLSNNRGDNNNRITVKNKTIDKSIGAEAPTSYGKPEINQLFDVWAELMGYQIESKIKSNRNAANNLLKRLGSEKLTQLLHGVQLAKTDKYAPRIADFCALQSKLNELIAWGNTRRNTNVVTEF